ncbi:MAG: spore coat protein [Ruminococcaceae bacterium]|nr:spore coat protein [Oscillospiraceae bacterium]
MILTQKETNFLNDFRDQELLCIEKYEKYAGMACSSELKALFTSLAEGERSHLKTINSMAGGTVGTVPTQISADNTHCCCANYCDEQSKKCDEFLCRDMLASEKHVSSIYDTGIFEFSDPQARKMLNHIQAEEQQHGERIYAYMKSNGMYS